MSLRGLSAGEFPVQRERGPDECGRCYGPKREHMVLCDPCLCEAGETLSLNMGWKGRGVIEVQEKQAFLSRVEQSLMPLLEEMLDGGAAPLELLDLVHQVVRERLPRRMNNAEKCPLCGHKHAQRCQRVAEHSQFPCGCPGPCPHNLHPAFCREPSCKAALAGV